MLRLCVWGLLQVLDRRLPERTMGDARLSVCVGGFPEVLYAVTVRLCCHRDERSRPCRRD